MTNRVRLLCTDIGRGHPFYLDGLRSELLRTRPNGAEIESQRVAEAATWAGKLAWSSVGFLYHQGSSPGAWSWVYRRVRTHQNYNRRSVALSLLRNTWKRSRVPSEDELVVVAHPLLVAALRPHPRLYYMHGEVVTPVEAVVMGAHRIFAPTTEAATPFLKAGYTEDQVVITGLCIEPALVAEAKESYPSRLERLSSHGMLTGAFFSSGAEPRHHVNTLTNAAASVARHEGRALVFARKGGRLHIAIQQLGQDLPGLSLLTYSSRSELEELSARRFPEFDYVVAPPHERTHWGLGLGLPMFLLGPDVGPFAPLNRTVLLQSGVAQPLEGTGEDFAKSLAGWHSTGQLNRQSERGWSGLPLDGFAQAARFIWSEWEGAAY